MDRLSFGKSAGAAISAADPSAAGAASLAAASVAAAVVAAAVVDAVPDEEEPHAVSPNTIAAARVNATTRLLIIFSPFSQYRRCETLCFVAQHRRKI
jgi:hypothetical protein